MQGWREFVEPFARVEENAGMANIESVLKSEISRLARKEVRQEVEVLRKAVVGYRGDIAALKRRMHGLEATVRHLVKASTKAEASVPEMVAEASTQRFSAKALASSRKRLNLTAAEFAKLVGSSSLSIYKWEQGKAKPRAKYLPAIAALRTIGKREAQERLLSLG